MEIQIPKYPYHFNEYHSNVWKPKDVSIKYLKMLGAFFCCFSLQQCLNDIITPIRDFFLFIYRIKPEALIFYECISESQNVSRIMQYSWFLAILCNDKLWHTSPTTKLPKIKKENIHKFIRSQAWVNVITFKRNQIYLVSSCMRKSYMLNVIAGCMIQKVSFLVKIIKMPH